MYNDLKYDESIFNIQRCEHFLNLGIDMARDNLHVPYVSLMQWGSSQESLAKLQKNLVTQHRQICMQMRKLLITG